MTPEKRKELLHHAAENPDAKFFCTLEGWWQNEPINTVLEYPEYNWEIVKEPVVTVEYYVASPHGFATISDEEYFDNWDLRITTTDGVRVAELRENVG